MKISHSCCLCSQIVGASDNDLISTLLPGAPYERRVALESDQFAVVPSLGPLATGHVLLCPKAHIRSFAHLDPSFDAEYRAFRREVVFKVKTTFANPVHCFEHGSSRTGHHIPCTVEHAHLHLVPAAVEVASLISQVALWEEIGNDAKELRERAGEDEYLYYQFPSGRTLLARAPVGGFESQLLRKTFAEALGRPSEWNWRETPQPLATHAAFERLLRGS
jgi:ATP adenylyltransferase